VVSLVTEIILTPLYHVSGKLRGELSDLDVDLNSFYEMFQFMTVSCFLNR